jgi:predicted permease
MMAPFCIDDCSDVYGIYENGLSVNEKATGQTPPLSITMGGMAYLVFRQLLVMMCIVVVSFLVAKKNHFGEKESHFLSYLLLYVIAPAMIIDAYNIPYDASKMHYFLIMALFSAGNLGVLILLSLTIGKSKNAEEDRHKPLDKLGVVYCNAGYIGIPIIQAVMGKDAVFYLMVYILVFNIFMWIHGQYLMTKSISFRQIITKPTIIAAIFSILLFITPWKLPYVVGETVHLIGDLNTCVSMILLGILFATFEKPKEGEKFPTGSLVRLSFLRLIISPLISIVIFYCFRGFFAGDEILRMLLLVIVIVAACPCGVTMSSFAVMYDKNYSYATLAISLTTILCVGTVPLFTALAEKLF